MYPFTIKAMLSYIYLWHVSNANGKTACTAPGHHTITAPLRLNSLQERGKMKLSPTSAVGQFQPLGHHAPHRRLFRQPLTR